MGGACTHQLCIKLSCLLWAASASAAAGAGSMAHAIAYSWDPGDQHDNQLTCFHSSVLIAFHVELALALDMTLTARQCGCDSCPDHSDWTKSWLRLYARQTQTHAKLGRRGPAMVQ